MTGIVLLYLVSFTHVLLCNLMFLTMLYKKNVLSHIDDMNGRNADLNKILSESKSDCTTDRSCKLW